MSVSNITDLATTRVTSGYLPKLLVQQYQGNIEITSTNPLSHTPEVRQEFFILDTLPFSVATCKPSTKYRFSLSCPMQLSESIAVAYRFLYAFKSTAPVEADFASNPIPESTRELQVAGTHYSEHIFTLTTPATLTENLYFAVYYGSKEALASGSCQLSIDTTTYTDLNHIPSRAPVQLTITEVDTDITRTTV